MMSKLLQLLRVLPWPVRYTGRKLRALPEDLPYLTRFLFCPTRTPSSFIARLRLLARCYRISYFIDCPHRENEAIQVIQSILDLPAAMPGVIVEAGSFKGGSGAKLSLGAQLAD